MAETAESAAGIRKQGHLTGVLDRLRYLALLLRRQAGNAIKCEVPRCHDGSVTDNHYHLFMAPLGAPNTPHC